MGALLHVLASPDRAFEDERTYHVSRVLLVLLLFLIHSAGSELIARFYATPYMTGLVSQQQANDATHFAFGPPPGQGGATGPGARRTQVTGASNGPILQALGVVIQSSLFVLLSLITWWLLVIFIQFLGGEEAKTAAGPHRNSRYLVSYAWFPLALRRLTQGILINLQDPRAAWSAFDVAHYRRASEISLSPLSLAQLPPLPAPIAYLLYNLTDPFYLWFLFLIVYGGMAVFRLSFRGAILQGGFVVAMLYLLQTIFAVIGIHTGV